MPPMSRVIILSSSPSLPAAAACAPQMAVIRLQSQYRGRLARRLVMAKNPRRNVLVRQPARSCGYGRAGMRPPPIPNVQRGGVRVWRAWPAGLLVLAQVGARFEWTINAKARRCCLRPPHDAVAEGGLKHIRIIVESELKTARRRFVVILRYADGLEQVIERFRERVSIRPFKQSDLFRVVG